MVKPSAPEAPGTVLRFSSWAKAAVPDTVVISQCTAPATSVIGLPSRCPAAMSTRPTAPAADSAASASVRDSTGEAATVSAMRSAITAQVALALRAGDAAICLVRSTGGLLRPGRIGDSGPDRRGEVVLRERPGVLDGLDPPGERLDDRLAGAAPVQTDRGAGEGGDPGRAGEPAEAG